MSEVKKKNHSTNQQQLPDSAQQSNTVKQKRKRWMVEKYKKKRPIPVEKAAKKSDKLVPPTDGQHFSANWKKLQEVNEQVDYSLLMLLWLICHATSVCHVF